MALNINGVELDFDFTNPEDLMRYRTAMDQMEGVDIENLSNSRAALNDADSFTAYVTALTDMLRNFSAFLDEAFGEGTSGKLIGDKPSLKKVIEIQEAINVGAEAQNKALEAHYAKYAPNRAGRSEVQ